jgi:hypothetical protein
MKVPSAVLLLIASLAYREAAAVVILSPTAVVLNTAGTYNGLPENNIIHAINRSGLSATFASGVTDFDAYLAGGPTHTYLPSNAEWTSNFASTGDVVFDLGQSYHVTRLALWNEDFRGINSVRIDTSDDPVFLTFTTVANLAPAHTPGFNYPAQQFTLSASNARYVRLKDITMYSGANTLAMGEIAFGVGPVQAVPEASAFLAVALATGLTAFRKHCRGK